MIKNYSNLPLKNKEIKKPTPETVKTILDYSKSLNVFKSDNLGFVETMSN